MERRGGVPVKVVRLVSGRLAKLWVLLNWGGGTSALCRQLTRPREREWVSKARTRLRTVRGANVLEPWEQGWGSREARLLGPPGGRPGGRGRHRVRHQRQHSGTWDVLRGRGGRGQAGWAASVAESEENVSTPLFRTLPGSSWGLGSSSAPSPHRVSECNGSRLGGPGCPEVCGLLLSRGREEGGLRMASGAHVL